MRAAFAALVALVFIAAPAPAATLDARAVNEAEWRQEPLAKNRMHPVLIKAQVLLDRARFSPGEIDGKSGMNLGKAIAAFASHHGLPATDKLNDEIWRALTEQSQDAILKEYEITERDVRGPFAEKIPAKMEQMQDLPALSYRSARELLAEKFHMSEELLKALNPGRSFKRAGETIIVANVGNGALGAKAARLEVDKSSQTLRVFDRADALVAVYPVTVGSVEKPAPSGRLTVTGVTHNPTYRYNPDYAFKGVKATEPFKIKPGPNNPVGLVWIGLSEKGYGIHGTPDPSKIGKSESNGCIRMSNWDAQQLASAVAKGTPVEFIGDEHSASEARAEARKARKRR